ncbi:MAG TPA: glycerophosphodiester phosphodiesterase [Anaerolineales bacterium]|nr:glycerophosphodiester phosphodiesterase [Anaerolineales bacterium]HLO32014.1 glycerophosphodiester phosphodiesterase [Anaerolineales bacterium]
MSLELLKSRTGRTLIESHRGIEANVPENSWPAIKLGHQLGADLIEVDVQMSRDCVPFLRHNYQLPDGRWCGQVLWNELKELKIGGEPLPLLEDVLDWACKAGAILSLDIKTFFSPEGSLTREVLRVLERTNTKDKVLLLFFDHQELLRIKLVYPELTVRALVIGRLANYPEYLQKIKADCISVSYGAFHPVDIEQIHSAGVSVSLNGLWNPNSDLFQTSDIDIFSHGNPVEAKQLLGRQ